MASDFAPVQQQYLNLGEVLGNVEHINYMRQRQKALQQEMDNQSRLQGLFRGGQMPDPAQVMAADPHMGMQYQRTLVDKQNANTLAQREDQDLMKQVATNAMVQWKATGNNREAWPAIMHEARKQLNMMSQGRLGQDTNIEQFTPEMVSQFAGWQDPDQLAQRQAQNAATAEGLKAEAKARAEFPYDVAKEQAKPQRMQQPRPVDPLLNEKRRLEIEKAKREQSDKESGMNLTESQAKHTNYAMRMNEAEKNIQALEAEGYTPDAESVLGRAAGAVAGAAGFSPYAGLSDKGAKWMQAQDQWVNALLRSDTGAAYASYEPADLKRIFFAMPGESKEIKAQKAQQRKAAIEGILISSGKGRQRVEGYSAPQADTGGYSLEDLQHTAKKYGMTIEEVKAKLGAQ